MAELPHRFDHSLLAGGVQQCRGFVKQKQVGFAGQGACNREPLLLSPAEGMDRSGFHACESNLFEGCSDLSTSLMVCELSGKVQKQVAATAGQQQLMIGILKDQGWPQLAFQLAPLWFEQAADDPKQGAFAAAVAADDHPQAWAWDRETATIQCMATAGPVEADLLAAEGWLSRWLGLSHASREKPGRLTPPVAAVFS